MGEFVLPGDSWVWSVLMHYSLIALLELCDDASFNCSRLIVAMDRSIGPPESDRLSRDLGWVGFRPTTLRPWVSVDVVSDQWLFLGVDV